MSHFSRFLRSRSASIRSADAWVQIRPLIRVDGWPVTGEPMVPVPGENS
jgi:hypothetical protein